MCVKLLGKTQQTWQRQEQLTGSWSWLRKLPAAPRCGCTCPETRLPAADGPLHCAWFGRQLRS